VIVKDMAKGENFMNHRPPGLETMKAIQGFVQFKSAERLSPRTIKSYSRDLKQWVEYQGAMDVAKVTPIRFTTPCCASEVSS
jgi:hypothetical protein